MDKTRDPDNLFDDTVVSEIIIQLRRNGCMSIAGSISDEKFAKKMLDTARDTLTNYHIQRRMGNRSPLVVPAYDTALVGTQEEKLLLKAKEELINAKQEVNNAS
jgi:hypothetical protein